MRTTAIALFAVIALAGVAGCDRLPSDATMLSVGDCIDEPGAEEFSTVQRQPCNGPHDGEIFVVQDYENPPATVPTQTEFENWVLETCTKRAFLDYTGLEYDAAQDIDVAFFTPTSEGWSDGDKEMVCYLVPVDGGKMSTSLKKAG